MRLVTWNVAGRVTRHAEQAAAVAALTADVVCLQEVTARTLPMWRAALGLEHTVSPLDWYLPPKPRRLGVLIAARLPSARRSSWPSAGTMQTVRVPSRSATSVLNTRAGSRPSAVAASSA